MNSHVVGRVVGHGPVSNDGWYIPVSPVIHTNTPTIHHIKIHDFWQTRLAPFPGYSSRPGLFPTNKQNLIPVNSPASTKERPKLQLLPPRSLAPLNIELSPIQSDIDIKSENNNVSASYPLLHLLTVTLGPTLSFR
jgi:hypothetical protein